MQWVAPALPQQRRLSRLQPTDCDASPFCGNGWHSSRQPREPFEERGGGVSFLGFRGGANNYVMSSLSSKGGRRSTSKGSRGLKSTLRRLTPKLLSRRGRERRSGGSRGPGNGR